MDILTAYLNHNSTTSSSYSTENNMHQNTGFVKTIKTRGQVYQGPKGKAERHAWKRTDKRKAYE